MSDDGEAITATIARVSHCIDAKRWDPLRALYAPRVAVDYTSLFGGTPQDQTAEELVAGWQKMLTPVVTHHQLGPVEVTVRGARAGAECHVVASHHASGGSWIVEGHYVFELTQNEGAWTITRMVLQVHHEIGDRKIVQSAD